VVSLHFGLHEAEYADVKDGHTSTTSTSASPSALQESRTSSDEAGAAQSVTDHPTISSSLSSLAAESKPSDNIDSAPATVLEKAVQTVQMGKVTLDVCWHLFIVDGTTDARLVRLFPQPMRSCPTQTSCDHVEEVHSAVGINSVASNRWLNLTPLHMNKCYLWLC